MQANWQVDFFRGVALEFWRRVTTTEQTRAEVDFLEQAMQVRPGAHLLDVPCGSGRHVVEFSIRDYRMTGVDLSEEFIADAQAQTPSAGRWVLGDMRELTFVSEFDGAYCFGNSFCYFDRNDARKFLSAVAKALKPGARFILETGMAAESILPGLVKTRWFRAGDIYMLSENQYHPREGRLDIQYTFIRGGEVDTRPTSSYTFTAAEICRMHSEAGLETVELLGSVVGEPYQLGSQRLILASQKAASVVS